MRSLARLLRASAGVALTCLGSRVGALKPLPHRLLHPAIIGGHVTTEFLRDVPDEVFHPRGAAAAVDDERGPILEGLEECIDDASTHVDADVTMQIGSEQESHGEEDDADNVRGSDDDGGRDDDDNDLISPFTRDAPAGSSMHGGEAPGTAAPHLALGKVMSCSAAHYEPSLPHILAALSGTVFLRGCR